MVNTPYTDCDTNSMTDQWQEFRFLVWPFIAGSATVLMIYIVLWFITRTRLRRKHAVACAMCGVLAWFFSSVIASSWDNSAWYWAAFTIGLTVMAGVMVVTSVLLIRRVWREK